MNKHLLAKDSEARASKVCQPQLFSRRTQKLLTEDLTPRAFLDQLIAKDLSGEAILFLASALPPRVAIWWGCLCVQMFADEERQSPDELAALRAAARWVLKPSPQPMLFAPPKRSPTIRITQALGVAGEGKPTPNSLVPRYLLIAILGAAALAGPEQAAKNQRRCLALGIQIAQGKFLPSSDKKES